MATDSPRIARLREIEVWISRVRLVAVLFALIEVGILSEDYPPGYEDYAWIVAGVFAVGSLVLFAASTRTDPRVVGAAALLFDTCVVASFATIYSFEYGSPTRWALIFVVTEAALRYGLMGAVVLPLLLFPYLVFAEWWRVHHFGDGPGFIWDRVTFPFGVFLITGAIVGWLVKRLGHEAAIADARALEAEALRDELGRRVDVLEAANRCARALASSLDLDQAFGAFSRELRGLLAYERVTLVLVENGRAEVMAVAGRGTDRVFPPGSARPVEGSVLEEVLEGTLVYREAMDPPVYPEEAELLSLGRRAGCSPRCRWGRAQSGCSVSSAPSRTRSHRRSSSSCRCSGASSRRPCRTSARTRRSAALQTSCDGCRRSARISSRSCRTSCAVRWRQ
jgi:hypothetical protein